MDSKRVTANDRERTEFETLQAQGQVREGVEVEKIVVPIVEEHIEIEKREIETGGVRVRKVVREREETIDVPLLREEVEVERVPVNRVVDGPVQVRYEGETAIIPVLEEVLVVEKRLMLKEELRVTRKKLVTQETKQVLLKSEGVIVERLEPAAESTRSSVGVETAHQRKGEQS